MDTILTQPTRTINPEFVVTIIDQQTADFVTPFMLGVLAAERGELCVPEVYYTKRGQMREFADGFESVAGETLSTCQILGKRFVDYAAELEDLQEAMADNAYHAGGGW